MKQIEDREPSREFSPAQEGYFTVTHSGQLIPRKHQVDWVREHLNGMESLLDPQSGLSLLDLGSGAGYYSLQLGARNHLNVVAVDHNLTALKLFESQSSSVMKMSAIRSKVEAVPVSSNTFDYGICNHVLEHVTDDKLVLDELFRLLKRGGHAVVGVPLDLGFIPKMAVKLRRFLFPFSREVTLEGVRPGELQEELVGEYSHVRFYDREAVRQRLRRVGFNLRSETGISIKIPGGYGRFLRKIPGWMLLTDPINTVLPSLSASLLMEVEKP